MDHRQRVLWLDGVLDVANDISQAAEADDVNVQIQQQPAVGSIGRQQVPPDERGELQLEQHRTMMDGEPRNVTAPAKYHRIALHACKGWTLHPVGGRCGKVRGKMERERSVSASGARREHCWDMGCVA